MSGLARPELCALDSRDLELDGRKSSLLVRCGKGRKPRRQPVPAGLARELRATARAGIEKHVNAHTLRHTAATWLRQELGDTRLVAELFDAAGRLEQLAAPSDEFAEPDSGRG